jgi:hypothetical protein
MVSAQTFLDRSGHNCGLISVNGAYTGIDGNTGAAVDLPALQLGSNDLVNMALCAHPLQTEAIRDRYALAFNYTDCDWVHAIPRRVLDQLAGKTLNIFFSEPLLGTAYDGLCEADAYRAVLNGRGFDIFRGVHPSEPLGILRDWAEASGIRLKVFLGEQNEPDTTYHDIYFYCGRDFCAARFEDNHCLTFLREADQFRNLRYKIGSFNGRWRFHRALLVAALAGMDRGGEALVTWMHPPDDFTKVSFAESGLRQLVLAGQEKLAERQPWRFAVHEVPEADPTWSGLTSGGDSGFGNAALGHLNSVFQMYPKCAAILVSETNFFIHRPNISEKTLLAMTALRPFIVAAPPGTLALIRSLGFKTFPELFDESYDEIEDHEQRLSAVAEEIRRWLARPREEMREMLIGMRNRLFHNNNYLLSHLTDKMAKRIINEISE